MCPQHNQPHTDCFRLPGGFGTIGSVLLQRGQAEKPLRKPCDRQDKMPPEMIAKGTRFNTAIS